MILTIPEDINCRSQLEVATYFRDRGCGVVTSFFAAGGAMGTPTTSVLWGRRP